ncbi:MAG TPA: DUF3078 domain-containing protein [Bacteroides sp.]|nr:DUF3078 domain-containing protein [Bacteroides sp.]
MLKNPTQSKHVHRVVMIAVSTALVTISPLSAQDSPEADTLWKFNGITSVNFSQLSLSNWAAGGENSLAGNVLVQLSEDFDNGISLWDNDLVIGYGLIRQGDDPTRKSDDRLDLSSKFGHRASENWLYTALLGFRTQFAPGYDNPGEEDRTKISNWLAPGYLNLSVGMDYRPGEHLSVLMAPLAGKVTFVLDEELSALGTYGLDPDQTVRGEFGGFLRLSYQNEILKNVLLDTRVDLFSNYLDRPQDIDVNWDLLLNFIVNDFLSAKLMTQLIFDKDIQFDTETEGVTESRVQFKELFGVGLTFSF